ncbi:phosphate-starvation-inducible PsiE family protein [Methanoplanus sp. FWC-SCC4]|uniref:Phosphate-starvation-inducible PsiE family protein n=1 Tax=Methanochimaera problematica TaxID=2609417 RepID=A0AA97FBN2_9EURY|nr:phosphate-starvation-inducible PsiE family protein [Methanoplanus sp. FWC-SCC4]WOF16445.1 phosphate-starvation-inducible PsiE family protein [Methanoplanus sp. FWC-SCC4]
MNGKILKGITNIETAVYFVLMIILTFVIIFSLFELALMIIEKLLYDNTPYILEAKGILQFFEFFLLILIGLELMETIKSFIETKKIQVEIVLILAIIAISRKIIVIDPATASEFELMGIGLVVIGLTAGYYFIKKADSLKYAKKS